MSQRDVFGDQFEITRAKARRKVSQTMLPMHPESAFDASRREATVVDVHSAKVDAEPARSFPTCLAQSSAAVC
jgi:hypothetical protein